MSTSKRERIAEEHVKKVCDAVTDCLSDFDIEANFSFTEEFLFLRKLSEKCRKFRVKYSLLNKYGVGIPTTGIDITGKFWTSVDDIDISYAPVDRISNSVTQPKIGEWLMCYAIPVGRLMFNPPCDVEFFDAFLNCLSAYGALYKDELNNKLYFTLDDGMKLLKDIPNILNDYYQMNRRAAKEREAERLRSRLKELEREGVSN